MPGEAYTTSPDKFVHHLQGVEYPARKEDLMRVAHSNAAPPEVIRAIEGLPNSNFGTEESVKVAYASMQ